MGDEEVAEHEQQTVEPQRIIEMAHSIPIQPMQEFNPDAELGASLATRWNNWISDFEMFIVAAGITDDTRKRALLLYQAGARIREIFKQLPDTGRESDYEIAKDKLKGYFEPQKNNRYEVYRFRQATQDPYETLDQFHTRLRTLSQTCEFNNTNFEIEQQILVGGTSSKLRKRALRDPNFKLADMLLEGRRDEQSKYQAKDIEAKEPINAETHKVNTKKPSKCYNCGKQFPHKGECPAKGKTCNACGKSNHFAIVCRSEKTSKANSYLS